MKPVPPILYAIVDIETTGGFAAANGITEIAVLISDGSKVIEQFHTLLNPHYTIPRYVESLTGITNEMVEYEPNFESIADELYELLQNKIFVAHNVNFDFSFIHHHLLQSGLELKCQKLCTVRLGRLLLPALKGYGLDKICRHLGIEIESRHRALGDAAATAKLFHHLLQSDSKGQVKKMLKSGSKEQFLPPNIQASEIKNLPRKPGVYYFHDKKGKVIYVGKARNLNQRVNSHFSNNKTSRQKQEFLKKIYHITYQLTATELMAFILESIEIKKRWPEQNKSQKRFEQTFGLYSFEDSKGYLRLCIDKKKRNIKAFYTFNLLTEGYTLLRKLVAEFQLCPKLCFLQSSHIECQDLLLGTCLGACQQKEPPEQYNERVKSCVSQLEKRLPTFALLDEGLNSSDHSCILIEQGRFYGMGYLPAETGSLHLDELKHYLTPYTENEAIRGMVYQYAAAHPTKRIGLAENMSFSDKP